MKTILYKSILLLIVFTSICAAAFAQRTIPLYKRTIPNTTAVIAEDKTNADKSVFHRVINPTLSIYLPVNNEANKTAVIICAGGGYAELNIKREGHNIAEAFNKAGIAAFVLKYRLPDDKTNNNKTLAPLQDAQQAIKIVRDSAAKWNIDKAKIGIMGFSAGGHLASSAGTHYNDALIANASHTSLRPDFMILVYPVISFNEAFGHIGSRNHLLGKKPPVNTINYFSGELHVNNQTPPAFLVHAGDDDIVNVTNSIKFYEALQKNGVNADLHIYAKGGHGFGTLPAFEEWFGRCIQWMRTAQLIK